MIRVPIKEVMNNDLVVCKFYYKGFELWSGDKKFYIRYTAFGRCNLIRLAFYRICVTSQAQAKAIINKLVEQGA